jgi:hypothetical protein
MDHTDMTTPTPPEALAWHDVICCRPYMYLGDGGKLGTLYLLSSLLECPLQPTSIVVILEAGHIRIQARCVPPSVLPRESGQPPYLVEVCTRINAPIDSPASIAPLEAFDADREPPAFKRLAIAPPYLAIANALSEYFQIGSITNGVVTRACFERGVLRSDLLAESTSEADGLEVQFTLDEIGPHGDHGRLGRFSRFDLGAEVAREFANVRRVPVTVIHRMAGEERRFLAEPGAG